MRKSLWRERFREMLGWFFWVIMRRIIMILPRQIAYLIAEVVGRSLYPIQRTYLNTTRQTLLLITENRSGSLTPPAIVRKAVVNHLKKEIEVFFFPQMARQEMTNWITIKDRANLDFALQRRKGAILLHLHFGAVHIPILALGLLGYPIAQVGVNQLFLSDNSSNHLSYFRRKVWETKFSYEKNLPAKFIYVGASPREIFSWLADNRIADIAADGRQGTNRMQCDFLGQTLSFSTGPFRIAKRVGAIIVPTFVIRPSPGFLIAPISFRNRASWSDAANRKALDQ